MLASDKIIGYRDIYFVDLAKQELVLLNDQLMATHKQLSQGIARVSFSIRGDGFTMTTALGEELTYYPDSGLLLNPDEVWDFSSRAYKLPKNTPISTKVEFSATDNRTIGMRADDKVRLIEYKRQYPYGYPYFPVVFYPLGNTEGTHFLSKAEQLRSRIQSWRDVTPGRNYFLANVKCYNKDYALIRFQGDLMPDTPKLLQLLRLSDGEVLWTKEVKFDFIESCVIDPQGNSYWSYDYQEDGSVSFDIQGNQIGSKVWE